MLAIIIHCDSQSLIGKVQNIIYNSMSRNIHLKYNTIKQLISIGVISIDYVKSKDNIVHLLTK